MTLAVEMKNITKTFYGMKANDDISFQVVKGEIHALLGENGAGKSTLMNILFGLYQADQGEIRIHEKPVKVSDPQMAIQLGIGMVHQHFMLVDRFTVLENIILGAEPRKGTSIDIHKASKEIETLSNQYGLKINLNSQVRDISIGMQQRVEILKTLYRGADILIFDEPTAVLTPQEILELASIMKNLTDEGKTVILITHKLKEILAIADAVTVIRRGKVCDSLRVKDTNEAELAEKMVGRKVTLQLDKEAKEREGLVLSLRDVRARDNRGLEALHGIDLEVYGGEIVGIAGVDGNGQSELVEVITGLRQIQSGEIVLAGDHISGLHTRQINELGVAHIPEDRHRTAIVMDMTLSENLVLNSYFKEAFNKRGLLSEKSIKAHARKLIDKFDIRTPSESAKIRALSGGNQQKAVIAREIEGNPKLLIAAQPTRGLDVGAIEFIHRQILQERDQGKAVLLVSFELEEILSLSDRIAVIYEGRIVGIVDPKETTEQELGLLMSGRTKGKETADES